MAQRLNGVRGRTPPPVESFVGRAAPLAVLRRCLDDAFAGSPRAVLVQGEAGIGKSRLVAELLPNARDRGALVLIGRCSEDLSVPYLPLASALAPLGDELGIAVELLDRPSSVQSDSRAALDTRPAGPLVAACRAAVRTARRRPVVLLIEDLHWADPHTSELFDQLVATSLDAGATASTAILVVATLRPSAGHVARIAERLLRMPDVRLIRLGGMNEFEVNELLTSLTGARPSRALLASVVDATDGNPLLARTLLGRLTETGGVEIRAGELWSAVGDRLPMVGGLDEELRRRLDRVGERCRSLLTRAAFVGDGGLLADLDAVVPPSPPDVDTLLDEAQLAGLLHDDGERYWFDHPQLRHVLYNEPQGRRRQRLHLELADQLEARHGGDSRRVIEIADHLRRGGPGVDRRRLARFCVAAGDQAFALGAWGTAARFLDDALAADPPHDPDDLARLILRAGIGHFRNHDLHCAEGRLLEAIDAAKAADDRDVWRVAALLVTRARMTIGTGSVGARIDTSPLDELLALEDLDERTSGEIVGLLAEVSFHAFDFEAGLSLLEEARLLAARSGDDALGTSVELAAGLQHLGRLELGTAEAAFRASARRARGLPDGWQRVWGLGRLPLVELMRGDLEAAAAHATEAAEIASSNHDWAEHALASACATQVAVARGELAAAEASGAVALQMYLRSDYAMVPLLTYPALAAGRALRGDVTGAGEALDDWAADGGRGLAPFRMLALAAALEAEALAAAPPFRSVTRRPVDLVTLPLLCAQVEVGAARSEPSLLDAAYPPLQACHDDGVRWCLGWPMLLGRLLAVASRLCERFDDAARWCDVAAAEAAAAGATGEAARVTLERAHLAIASGDGTAARALAAEAAREFDRLGMLPLSQAARRLCGGPAGDEGIVRTILFTDLVGSTAMNIRRGDVQYLELLRQHNAILRNRIRRFDGVEIKHTGDGIASWFPLADAACECAVAARDDLAAHNASHPDTPFFVRFGLASGSPIPHEGDLFGVVVALAARLCDKAAPGQILASEQVAAAAGPGRLTFRALEPIELKGFPQPVAAYAVGSAI